MRTSKIVALVATAALLAVGAAFTAFAATGWVEDAGSWKYYDKNGDAVTDKFVKNGDNYYYLDSDEYMATEKLVEYNSNYYWVDETGKMVTNQWVKVPNSDNDDNYDEYIYYYFQSTGKAYKGSDKPTVKTVNGKKYVFDEAGKMRYGWLDSNYGFVSNDNNDAYINALYYCGDADDGARVTSAWLKQTVAVTDSDNSTADAEKWFYFDNNGKKVYSVTKTINGKKYIFNENGIMASEWAATSTATGATASISHYAWFQDAENGAKLMKGWFKVVPQENVNNADYTDETAHWFYAKGNGELVKSTIKTINGKQYGFNDKGEMVAGLQYVEVNDDVYSFTAIDDSTKIAQVVSLSSGADPQGVDTYDKWGVRFFSADEDNDGAMKTGSVKVTVDGDDYNFKFATKGVNKGVGKTGKDGNYYYLNGCKITADADLKVQAFTYTAGTAGDISTYRLTGTQKAKVDEDGSEFANCVLLTSSGTIVKSGTKTDADGYKYKVDSYVIKSVTYSE